MFLFFAHCTLFCQHVYEDTTKDTKVLSTCNQFNPAQYNPDIFQPVELADEEVRVTSMLRPMENQSHQMVLNSTIANL